MIGRHAISAKDLLRLHQFGKKRFLVASSLVMCCLRVESGKEILVADIEELEKSSASGIHARRHNAKEVLASKHGDEFKIPCADGTIKLARKGEEVRTSIPTQNSPDRGVENRDGLQ